jgi:hypothetical protein
MLIVCHNKSLYIVLNCKKWFLQYKKKRTSLPFFRKICDTRKKMDRRYVGEGWYTSVCANDPW